MELHSEHNELNTNLTTHAHVFTIHASAKAFKILSSNLYKDKIAAVIRELSCNALDSHVDAGNPDPFIVHLPSQIEPFFAVEDRGTGMTPEQIAELYTGYFASSKTERNDQIGALGLGSKSPFAYTDMFTIDSVCKGTKTTYSAFLDKEGLPTYMTVNAEYSNEPNGVRITFPVPEKDFNDFAERAARIFWAFDRKPTITGAVKRYNEYVKDAESITLTGSGWKFYKKYPDYILRKYSYDTGALVRMGNILYPVKSLMNETGFDDVQLFLQNPLVIDMPLGSCDINPSREELSYDQLTKDNIHEKLLTLRKELEANFNKQVQEAKTPWEAAQLVRKYYTSFIGSKDEKYSFTFKGKEYKCGQEMSIDKPNYQLVYEQYRGKNTIRTSSTSRRGSSNTQSLINMADKLQVQLGNRYLIIISGTQDVSSVYLRTRTKMYCQAQSNTDIYIKVVNSITQKELDDLGNPPVVLYTDLPKQKYTPTVKATPKKQVRLYGSDTPVDFKTLKGKKYIYVIEHRKQFYIDKDMKDPTNLVTCTRKEDQLGRIIRNSFSKDCLPESITKKIYIVPYKLFEELKLGSKRKSWVSLRSVLTTGLSHLYNKYIDAKNDSAIAEKVYSFYSNVHMYDKHFREAGLAAGSPMLKALDILTGYKTNVGDGKIFAKAKTVITQVDNAIARMHFQVVKTWKVEDMDEFEDPCRVYITYPLLRNLFNEDRYYGSRANLTSNTFKVHAGDTDMTRDDSTGKTRALDDVIAYIKMVDSSNGIK